MSNDPLTFGNKDRRLFCDAFWRAASWVPSGVAVVAGFNPQGNPFGFTVSSLSAVSAAPPLVSICIDRGSRRIEELRCVRRFSINLLGQKQASLAKHFATPGIERFENVSWHAGEFGVPVLNEVLAVFFCEYASELEAGDHQLILGEVKDLALLGGDPEPLVYWRRAFHSIRLEYPFTESEAGLEAFIEGWKLGTLPKSQWTHGAHVAVAAYFAFDHSPELSFEKTKAGILHFNTCVGTPNTDDEGYHETLTRFWSDTVGSFVRNGRFASRLEAVRKAVRAFGEDRDRHRLFYSFDVVRDRTARRFWIAPDRNPSPQLVPLPIPDRVD